MAIVHEDIIEGTATFTFDGWHIERVFAVTGLAGEKYDKMVTALNTLGVPALGDAHPSSQLTDCYLREAIPSLDPKDNSAVRIRLVYANATWPTERQQINTLEVGGSLSQIQTNLDRFGNAITVSYTYPSDYKLDSELAGDTITTSGMVTKLIPERHIVKRRVEYADPSIKSQMYLGAVNHGSWNLDISATEGQWLCTQLEGVSNDGGVTWIVTYGFQCREDSWSMVVVFIDPNTGRPPADLVNNVGIKSYQEYKIRNFNALQL